MKNETKEDLSWMLTDEEEKEIEEIIRNGKTDKQRMYDVLKLLGFTFSKEEKCERWWKVTGGVKIAVDFTAENPAGRIWAKRRGNGGFLTDEEVQELPTVKLARELWVGSDPLPPEVIYGVVNARSKSGKGILVEFEDAFEGGPRQIWYAVSSVKTNRKGMSGYIESIDEGASFIPAGFSKGSETTEARLRLPRPIVLTNFKTGLESVPVVTAETREEEEEVERAIAGTETDEELMRRCLQDGIRLVKEIIIPEFELSVEAKADLVIRIANSLFINRSRGY